MKILFIGGTGLISSACSELAVKRGYDLTILNRGKSWQYPVPAGASLITADMHGDIDRLHTLLDKQQFDAVVDWIAFTPADLERDFTLFHGKTGQFVFISSASAYQKPPLNYLITEETPLVNPFWQYSRDKIACEEYLVRAHREKGFPSTIIRPSLTYGPSTIPLCVNSWEHPYTAIDRIRHRKKLIIPGDGTSLWVLTWNADFALGLLGLLGNPAAIGEAFHITTDEVLTWDQVYLETYAALGIEPNIIHIPSDLLAAYNDHYTGSLTGDKSNSVVFDNTKIKRYVPDFKCTVTWAEGVRMALAWFDADPSRKTVDEQSNHEWDQIINAYEKCFPVK